MSKFGNFVRCALEGGLAEAQTEQLDFNVVLLPPPDPAGELARVLMMDDDRRPTVFEVIGYTRAELDGTGGTLSRLTRGMDGTTAREWDDGAFITQDIPAALVEVLGESGDEGDALKHDESGLLRFDEITWPEIVGKPTSSTSERFNENATPATPPTEQVALSLTSGSIRATFDNDTSTVIASPP